MDRLDGGSAGGYLDEEFEVDLGELLGRFKKAYLAAKGFDEPLEDIGPTEDPGMPTSDSDTTGINDQIDYLHRKEAEGYSSDVDLTADVECFRGVCSQIMIDEYEAGSLKRALDLMPPDPKDNLLAIIQSETSDWFGPAAVRFKTYVEALNWSAQCQRMVLNLLLGAFTAYGDTLDSMRRNVTETLERGTEALEQLAESGGDGTTAELLKIALAGALGAATGGTGLAMLGGGLVGSGGAAIENMIERGEWKSSFKGEADEILKSTKDLLDSVRTQTRDRCADVVAALGAIGERIEDEKFRRGADGAEWVGIRLEAPGMVKFLGGADDFDLGNRVAVELNQLLVVVRDHLPDVEHQASTAKTKLADATWETGSLFTGELFEAVGERFETVLNTELSVLEQTVTNIGATVAGLKKVVDNYQEAESYGYERAVRAYRRYADARGLD